MCQYEAVYENQKWDFIQRYWKIICSSKHWKNGIWTLGVRTILIVVLWTLITSRQVLQSGSCLTCMLWIHTGNNSDLLPKMENQPNFARVIWFLWELEEVTFSKIRQILLFRIWLLNFSCFTCVLKHLL